MQFIEQERLEYSRYNALTFNQLLHSSTISQHHLRFLSRMHLPFRVLEVLASTRPTRPRPGPAPSTQLYEPQCPTL